MFLLEHDNITFKYLDFSTANNLADKITIKTLTLDI